MPPQPDIAREMRCSPVCTLKNQGARLGCTEMSTYQSPFGMTVRGYEGGYDAVQMEAA